MKIREIVFKNFRAYQDEVFTIPEDKDIILIYARNGFGKTSFFDGIEWGLTGELKRYSEKVRERTEYPLLRNSFSSVNVNDGIKITFDTNVNIKRFIKEDKKSDYNLGQLMHNGENIESLNHLLVHDAFINDIDFSKSFTFTQLLSQELLSDFVRHTKDNDRYKTVVDLFGLSAYKDYDEHIKQSLLYIDDEMKRVEDKNISINKNILLLKNKLILSDNESSKQLEKLEKIYGSKIDLNDILVINEELKESYEKLLKEKLNYTNNIENLDYLKRNFDEKEKKILESLSLFNEITEYKKYIADMSKKVYFENIDIHLENEKLYDEDRAEQIKQKIKKLDDISQSHPFFDKSNQGDNLIKLLAEYKEGYKDRITQYFNSKKIKEEQEKIVLQLEDDLKRISGLKNELYYIAKKFLEDSQSEKLTECPICENEFNKDNTLSRLSGKLNTNVDNEFQSIHNSIKKTRDSLILISKNIEDEKENILKICENIKNEYREQYKKLLSEKKQNDIYEKSYNIVIESMQNLDIEQKDYKVVKDNYFRKIEQSRFYVKDMKKEYYENNSIQKLKKLEILNSEGQKYIRLKELYEIDKVGSIENYLKEQYQKEKEILYKIEMKKTACSLSSKLVVFEQNSKELKRIKDLENTLLDFEKEFQVLKEIKTDFDDLKKSIKITIDDETKRLLSDYGKVIEKFYHYLNPSIYMNKLSIKETKQNANRLVFEVSSENGKKHSPSYIFSSAQNNVLALSIFLSFAIKQKWSKLDTVFLDDPIQNMDDINIHSFVDLIRSIQKQTDKQFFISTHDERIYNFMLNKFGKDNVHSFILEDYGKLKQL